MYRLTVKLGLIFVFLVIIAGSVVRMTDSGMGCPDWPKCFGHLIPPTEQAQIEWHPGQEFHEGQIIIHDESLQQATSDFTSEQTYNPEKWTTYTKHDYAEFNAFHTWVEFINRMFGMLSGIFVFLMAIVGTYLGIFKFKTYRKRIITLSWFAVFMIGVAAWLGAVVVYTVLEPFMITLHMLTSIVIILVLLYLLYITKKNPAPIRFNQQFKLILGFGVALTLVQILLGTQVRQYVDTQVKIFGPEHPELWLAKPTIGFYVHRSFSIIIVLLNGFLWWKNREMNLRHRHMNTVMTLILIEVFIGILLYYFDFPFLSQPLHLLIALLLLSAQFYVFLHTNKQQAQLKRS